MKIMANIESGGKRMPKSNLRQQEIFVDFAEAHPDIMDRKSEEFDKLWSQCTFALNMHGRSRTANQWEKAMKTWEYHLRAFYRKSSQKEENTGESKSMTVLQMRALKVFGILAVDGDKTVPILGLGVVSTGKENIASTPKVKVQPSSSRDSESPYPKKPKLVEYCDEAMGVQQRNAEALEKIADLSQQQLNLANHMFEAMLELNKNVINLTNVMKK